MIVEGQRSSFLEKGLSTGKFRRTIRASIGIPHQRCVVEIQGHDYTN